MCIINYNYLVILQQMICVSQTLFYDIRLFWVAKLHHNYIFLLKSRPKSHLTADPGPGHNLVIPAPAKNPIPVGYCT